MLLSLIFMAQVAWAGFIPEQFEANMEQVYKSIRGEKKDPVHIFYKYPNKFYFENEGNAKVTYVCNGNKVWIYSPPLVAGEFGEVKLAKNGAYCFSKLFDSLKHGAKTNPDYKVTHNDKTALVNFSDALVKELQIKSVEILLNTLSTDAAKFSNVISFKISKLGQERPITLKILKIDDKVSVPDSKFNFVIPPKTNIQNL